MHASITWSSLLSPKPLSTWDKTHSAHTFRLLSDVPVNIFQHPAAQDVAATGTSEILTEEY